MIHKNLQNINNITTIDPISLQLSKVSWSILWRYLVFGLFFVAFLSLGYQLRLAPILDFFNFFRSLENSISTLGYAKAVTLYSHSILMLSIIRTIVGYVVTFVIFLYVTQLKYRDFSVQLEGPSLYKGILILSWAFYWRILTFMAVVSIISLLFIRPEWWGSYLIPVVAGHIAAFFYILVRTLKTIAHKMFGNFQLTIKKTS